MKKSKQIELSGLPASQLSSPKRVNGDSIMKVIFRLLLIIILVLATTEAFCEEKQSKIKMGSIGETLVDSYQIGIGDILEITTWKEPDFTRKNVMVRTDGKISFPLLNDLPAAGLSPIELKFNIEAGLKSYIENPVVTVHIVNPISQKFYILGEVGRTGEYSLVKHLTVLQAFALAGGFTEWASKKEIILLRHEAGKDKIFRINYKDIAKGKDFSQNLKLRVDDTIIVP
jgi:polysaccharide export outer membrane protein